jgi:nicotinate-nucleotide adenylyltransferase
MPGPERLGVLGGTFDPVHTGHVVMAAEVRHALALDRVLLTVAGDPWQKRGDVVAPAALRLAMVEAAVADVDGVEVSDLEIARTGPTYTADTVRELRRAGRELFLVVGADAARGMPTWRRLDEIRPWVTLVLVGRGGDHPEPPPGEWRVERVDVPRLDISSTDIRERVAAGRPIDGLVPPAAVRVLRAARLYTAR